MSNLSQFVASTDAIGDIVDLGMGLNTITRNGKVYIPVGAVAANAAVDFPEAYSDPYLRCTNIGTATGLLTSSAFASANGKIYIANGSNSATPNSAISCLVRPSPFVTTGQVSASVTAAANNNNVPDIAVYGTTVVIAVSGATSNARIYKSTDDGATFSAAAGAPSNTLSYKVAVNSSGTLWVAATNLSSTAGYICTSTDGVTFVQRTPSGGANLNVSRILWVDSLSAFVFFTGLSIYASTDGFTLTDITPSGYSFLAIATFGSQVYQSGKFYMKGRYGGVDQIVTTSDFTTFTSSGVVSHTAPLVDSGGLIYTNMTKFSLASTSLSSPRAMLAPLNLSSESFVQLYAGASYVWWNVQVAPFCCIGGFTLYSVSGNDSNGSTVSNQYYLQSSDILNPPCVGISAYGHANIGGTVSGGYLWRSQYGKHLRVK